MASVCMQWCAIFAYCVVAPSQVWEPISDEAKDLIVSMLRHNPKERPSAKRVLMHPWIQRFAPGDDYGSPTHSPTVAPSAVGFGQQAAQQRQMAQQDERSRMVPEVCCLHGFFCLLGLRA